MTYTQRLPFNRFIDPATSLSIYTDSGRTALATVYSGEASTTTLPNPMSSPRGQVGGYLSTAQMTYYTKDSNNVTGTIYLSNAGLGGDPSFTTITVTNASTLGPVTATSLTVSGTSTLAGVTATTVSASGVASFTASPTSATFTNNVTIGGNLTVTGSITSSGSSSPTYANLTVTGSSTLAAVSATSVTATGAVNAAAVIAGALTGSSSLTVGGGATLTRVLYGYAAVGVTITAGTTAIQNVPISGAKIGDVVVVSLGTYYANVSYQGFVFSPNNVSAVLVNSGASSAVVSTTVYCIVFSVQ